MYTNKQKKKESYRLVQLLCNVWVNGVWGLCLKSHSKVTHTSNDIDTVHSFKRNTVKDLRLLHNPSRD